MPLARNGTLAFRCLTLTVLGAAVLLTAGTCLADGTTGISIGGTDASAQMKDVQTMVTTLQTIGFKWVAPLIGSGLTITGIFQIATRRLGVGLTALASGGALFAIERIANSLSHLAGN